MASDELTIQKLTGFVPIEYLTREKFFLNENNEVQPLIEKVKQHYLSIVIDSTTGEGRKEIKKLAAELNKVKATIDDYGKEIVKELKAKPKKIDQGRKIITDALDEVYRKILAPVTEYEREQARIKAEEEERKAKEAREQAEELEKLRLEKKQREQEEKLRRMAELKAKEEAEQKIKTAELLAETAKREAALAIQQQQDEFKEKERKRLADEKRKADEEAKRLADVEHRRLIKNKIFADFVGNGIDRKLSIQIIQLIDEGKIGYLSIKY